MSETGIAEKLLRGSRNIDRMKKEVRDLISMLVGLIRFSDASEIMGKYPRGFRRCFSDESGVEWYVTVQKGKRIMPDVEAQCFLPGPRGRFEGFSTLRSVALEQNTIQRIHESLDLLAGGMLDMFPSLKEDTKPYLEATNKQFLFFN